MLEWGFIRGVEGQPDGLASITIGVEGRDEFNAILDRAREEGLCGDGWINMLGVKSYFTCMGEGAKTKLWHTAKKLCSASSCPLCVSKDCSLWQLIRM
jgi:hypothetical protein